MVDYELLSKQLMEYIALGKPIVSFELKETRISAGGAALYVRPYYEPAFAKATVQLMLDPELRSRMGQVGQIRVHREVNWRISSRNLLRANDRLFGKASHKAPTAKAI